MPKWFEFYWRNIIYLETRTSYSCTGLWKVYSQVYLSRRRFKTSLWLFLKSASRRVKLEKLQHLRTSCEHLVEFLRNNKMRVISEPYQCQVMCHYETGPNPVTRDVSILAGLYHYEQLSWSPLWSDLEICTEVL